MNPWPCCGLKPHVALFHEIWHSNHQRSLPPIRRGLILAYRFGYACCADLTALVTSMCVRSPVLERMDTRWHTVTLAS